ncbi:hypothetical protein H0486_17445 [Lachnospiraceae bacterium MD1]|jgi:hypothetical protein|uniref:Transcriptional regulator n=1 Tax=Variimorphobacter saccharofermentans TaxID=2755051 RepID=A0A839K453_9FIRM|nr:winged helix-turn-helix domain-containing protein [Variimorphobacter saccharofermentans]MBB2184654.1 hypothetical protein [Variimorphobacter saccharofermentans]
MKKPSSLEAKYNIIKENLSNQVYIMVSDISLLFPDLKANSIYWVIYNLVKEGYLKRIRNGVYSLNEIKGKSAVYLSETAKKVGYILDSEGYDYYFSGIDIVLKFMQHIPEEYPVMLFVKKNTEEEIIRLLKENEIIAIKANTMKNLDSNYINSIMRPNVIIYITDNFSYSENNVALTEKAFIDLFYAITRNAYPMSLQELGRTYSNMIRLGAIDKQKMITMSYKRNLQFDIRYIVENQYVSEGAKEIVKYI